MKRFYKTATVGQDAGGYAILLDGRPVKTPAKQPLVVPDVRLAEAIAAEWNAQGESIDPRGMHLTQLANTAIDRTRPDDVSVRDGLMAHADTDLLCYRAPADDPLALKQARVWQPLLDWAAVALDAPLRPVEGILPAGQPEASIEALRRALEALDIWRLTAVATAASSLGSLALAFALVHGRIDAAAAMAAAFLDEDHQAERWGHDAETVRRRRSVGAEIAEVERFARFLRGSGPCAENRMP